MNLYLLSALISAAMAFGSAWHIQNLRMESNENDRLTQQRAQEQEISRLEQARSLQVLTAQNDARLRERQLRLDAAAAESAIDSLRSALHRAVLAARTDPSICPDTAAATAELLSSCSTEYSALAGVCDRHVSDLRTAVTIVEALR